MYQIQIEGDFSSAHQLREYQGKCENLHGHNWLVKISLTGTKLDKAGMLVDFGIARTYLKEILSILDHTFLNNTPPFDVINPSAENICFYLFQEMKAKLNPHYSHVNVSRVDVWESFKSCASYWENEGDQNV